MSATIIPGRQDCVYTSCFCEENVWKLCHYVRESAPSDLDQYIVLFISNPSQKIPLWQQKTGDPDQDYLTVWDYHVIMVCRGSSSSSHPLVYDLDSCLPFPCPFPRYWDQGIRSDMMMRPDFVRNFRMVPADEYLNVFASDRSHMRRPDGSWMKPPPEYPCIQTASCDNNLHSFIRMENTAEFSIGTIFDSSDSLRDYLIDDSNKDGE